VTSFRYSLCYFTLELQAGARDATGQDAALFVHELQQEVRVFVVYVLNAVLLEAAIFLARILLVDFFVGEAHLSKLTGLRLPIVLLSAGSSRPYDDAHRRPRRACPEQ
jgi:hypothetical protein